MVLLVIACFRVVECRVVLTKSKSLRKSWRQDIMNSRESNGEAMRGEE